MQDRKPFTIPPGLLFLDVLGAVLLGLGLAKYFAGADLVPEAWRFEGYGAALIGAGFALMLPLIVHVVKKAAGGPRPRP